MHAHDHHKLVSNRPRIGHPQVLPKGAKPRTFILTADNLRQLEEASVRLRMTRAEVVRVAVEEFWAKTLTTCETAS